MSSKGNKTFKSFDDIKDHSTTLTAYDEVVMKGQAANIAIRKSSFAMSTQCLLLLQNIVWDRAAAFLIKKLILVWCPCVEPGNLATIHIEVSYDIGEDESDLISDETVINLRGRLTEGMKVEVFPTRPIIKKSQDAFYMPWRFSAKLDENTGADTDATLGVLKLWCLLDIKIKSNFGKLYTRPYISPTVYWTNNFYPYYVPFYLMKAVRGIKPLLWRDTLQYKKFSGDILPHVDTSVVKPADHLTLMQIMSKDDSNYVQQAVGPCHYLKGGSCTCGDKIDKFLSSVLLNNNGKCLDHGVKFDMICHQVLTGYIKTVDGACDITY